MRFLLLCLAALSLSQVAFSQSNFTRTNRPGPHSVGVRVIEQYDFSRGYRGSFDANTGKPFTGERARPIQTLVWYPAGNDTGRVMTVGDYLKLGGTTDNFDETPECGPGWNLTTSRYGPQISRRPAPGLNSPRP